MDPIIQINDLSVQFRTDTGITQALDGITFDVERGKVTAIVGESGSGKSVTANCVMRLIQPPGYITGGSIQCLPKANAAFDIVSLPDKDPLLYDLRGGTISMVFQEPMTALSPVLTVGNQISEAILCHRNVTKKQAWQEASDMLDHVGIGDVKRRMHMYPFEFSGGMRQRAVIAMALVCNPELLICDEPTTALDVTIQAEILTLIRDLQSELNNSVIFITHDLGVVAQIADYVVVMYQGRILEIGSVHDVLKDPLHPYTKGLLAAIPGIAPPGQRLQTISSVVDSKELETPYPLVTLNNGRKVSLPNNQIRKGTQS